MADITREATKASSDKNDSLLNALDPNLYRHNAFRIAELSVDASERDLAKRQQTVTMAAATGLPIPLGPGRALPLVELTDVETLTAALYRLRDPLRRLIDEFFWFWPHQLGQSGTDAALAALANDNIEDAVQVWRRYADQASEANISVHNLAVFEHATALDLEAIALTKTLSEDERARRDNSWQDALGYWRSLLEDEGFWRRLAARVRDLDDPRLTTDTILQFRATLPRALLSINAQLAVQAAERGDAAATNRQMAIMRSAAFPGVDLADVLSDAVEPLRVRIMALCKAAETATSSDPEHADEAAIRLMDQSQPLLAALDAALPAGHPARDGTRDEVALTVLTCDIPFATRTKNWERSLALLERALSIATSKTARTRLRENVEIDRVNHEEQRALSTCWWCEARPPDADSTWNCHMYGEVTREGSKIHWKSTTIHVPRCQRCKYVHERISNKDRFEGLIILALGGPPLLSVPIAALTDAFVPSIDPGVPVFAGFVIGLALMLRLVLRWSAWQKESNQRKHGGEEFPRVRQRLKQGWAIGQKPPGAQ